MTDTSSPFMPPDLVELNGVKKLLFSDGRVFRITEPPEVADLQSFYDRVDSAQDAYRREMARKCGIDPLPLPKRDYVDDKKAIVFASTGLEFFKTKYGLVVRES